MLGPYFRGLGKRKPKDDNKSESDSDGEKSIFFTQPENECSKRRRITNLDAEIIPKFDPEKCTSVKSWLHKIDQLGDLNDWNERDRIFVMQVRLRGAAREWYDDLEDYAASWIIWKDRLLKAFPRFTDFVDRLEEMLARKKKETETMTKYYHEKMSLIKKCDIRENENVSSCLIRGLPIELQANATAFSCESPEDLYYGFLSSLENFKKIEAKVTENKSGWRRGTAAASLPKICYNCRKTGHEARDCRAVRCQICQRQGHAASACWYAAGPSTRPPPPPQPQPLHSAQNYGEKNINRGTRQFQDGRVLQHPAPRP